MELWRIGPDDCFEDVANLLAYVIPNDRDIVYLCIGSANIVGDTYGPRVGSHLFRSGFRNVYGTMKNPVNAKNIHYVWEIICRRYIDPYVIAIDACVSDSPGHNMTLRGGAQKLRPGSGVGKNLGTYGDLSIEATVTNSPECNLDFVTWRLQGVPEEDVQKLALITYKLIEQAVVKGVSHVV